MNSGDISQIIWFSGGTKDLSKTSVLCNPIDGQFKNRLASQITIKLIEEVVLWKSVFSILMFKILYYNYPNHLSLTGKQEDGGNCVSPHRVFWDSWQSKESYSLFQESEIIPESTVISVVYLGLSSLEEARTELPSSSIKQRIDGLLLAGHCLILWDVYIYIWKLTVHSLRYWFSKLKYHDLSL